MGLLHPTPRVGCTDPLYNTDGSILSITALDLINTGGVVFFFLLAVRNVVDGSTFLIWIDILSAT